MSAIEAVLLVVSALVAAYLLFALVRGEEL